MITLLLFCYRFSTPDNAVPHVYKAGNKKIQVARVVSKPWAGGFWAVLAVFHSWGSAAELILSLTCPKAWIRYNVLIFLWCLRSLLVLPIGRDEKIIIQKNFVNVLWFKWGTLVWERLLGRSWWVTCINTICGCSEIPFCRSESFFLPSLWFLTTYQKGKVDVCQIFFFQQWFTVISQPWFCTVPRRVLNKYILTDQLILFNLLIMKVFKHSQKWEISVMSSYTCPLDWTKINFATPVLLAFLFCYSTLM